MFLRWIFPYWQVGLLRDGLVRDKESELCSEPDTYNCHLWGNRDLSSFFVSELDILPFLVTGPNQPKYSSHEVSGSIADKISIF